MVVELTETEILTLNIIGSLRGIGARAGNIKNLKGSSKDGHVIELEGLVGEYAFCKWKNIFYDIDPSPRSGSFDCTLDGYRMDIKTTRYRTGKLVGGIHKNPDIDIYVLAIYDGLKVWFPGFAFSEELYHPDNLVDLGTGNVYAMTQDRLTRFK